MKADLVGKKFGSLIVLRRSRSVPRGDHSSKVYWMCRCTCGEETEVQADNLRTGNTVSCGCLKGHRVAANLPLSAPDSPRSLERLAWRAMWSRCTYHGNSRYERYGGRGITVCERWKSFDSFLSDMGAKPTPKHSLDRIDNDGNYSPSNCRWATHKEQRRNRADYMAAHGVLING